MLENTDLYINEGSEFNIESFSKAYDCLPVPVIILKVGDWKVVYMNRIGLQKINSSLEEICALSNREYVKKYFNPDESEVYFPKIRALILNNDLDYSFSVYQQIKYHTDDDWKWYLSSSKVFQRDNKGKPSYIITLCTPIDTTHHMASKAEKILEENAFLRKNFEKFSKLSQREKIILGEIALGKSSIEIAERLCISSTTVDTHRRNIRAKLGTKSSFEISNYARFFELI